ncbi:MAG: diguanylate cyclase [bacterium]|nr:diguanylate cyclase [bacterium]
MKRFEIPSPDPKRPRSFSERLQDKRLKNRTIKELHEAVQKSREKEEEANKQLREASYALEASTSASRPVLENQEKKIEELGNLAAKDPLTGLSNRRDFNERLKEFKKRWEPKSSAFEGKRSEDPARFTNHIDKRKPQDFVVIMIDLDKFKTINDTLGHDAGDKVLQELGKFLIHGKVLRDNDFPARYGGEEFIVLCPETNLLRGGVVAEKIRAGIEALNTIYNGKVIKITASLGVSSAATTLDISAIVSKADTALYQAKADDGNLVRKAIPTRHDPIPELLPIGRL